MANDPVTGMTKEQFEHLFRTEIARLHNFTRQYVQDSDTAMDICQNVFVTLWEKRHTIDMQGAVHAYLYTAVRNRCLNYIRDNKKYRSRFLDLECTDVELFITGEPDTADIREMEHHVQAAIAALPEKCREVFEMSRFREMKYREIADALEISQKTVEAHMSKAMRLLREALSQYRVLPWLLLCFSLLQS